MKIQLYGRLADAIAREVDMGVGGPCTVGGIRAALASEHPAAAETLMSPRSRAVVGGSLVTDDQVVGSDATVEFLPPVSGG